jgi:hypothetical protein
MLVAPLALFALGASGCAGGAAREPAPSVEHAASVAHQERPSPRASAEEPPPPPSPCQVDADCRYDPKHERCGSDLRFNAQPPVVDQGVICYCGDDDKLCAMLRVWPVPCEGDASCAVDPLPRPHPVAASPEHPHERGKPCRDYRISTTCERTNICTLHHHECK